jgi:hypothetical protein
LENVRDDLLLLARVHRALFFPSDKLGVLGPLRALVIQAFSVSVSALARRSTTPVALFGGGITFFASSGSIVDV